MINKEQSLLKTMLPHIVAIIVFLAITMIYFSPVMDGKVLSQHDVTQFQGAFQELNEYYEKEGQSSAWTGSMFSGMPAYQIGIKGGSPNFLDYIQMPFKALGSNTAGPVFVGMLMAYLLFCIMGFKPSISIIGAIAYSLSSYNIIILEAGHVTKAWALAYMPLIVAGIMALFRKKILLGGLLVALGLALQIKNNHLQMTYYTGIFCFILFVAFAVQMISEKDIKTLVKACGVMIIALVMAAACNMGNIYSNLKMAEESTRGKSELTTPTSTEKQSSGLDKDYAFAWSYGKAETLSLMIPNIYGGSSGGMLDHSSNLYNEMVKNGAQVDAKGVRANTYWGEQPFTSGPVYFGAIICFLFILGMIVIRSKVKWALFTGTILFIFLSWGKNMEWFNDLFFYHFPLYNKFRAVSTALVIPALSVVMIAVWGIKEFLSGDIEIQKLKKALYISFGVVGGLCFFFWIAPGFFFNFTSGTDETWRSQVPDWYYNALLADRKDLLSADAFRSLIFVVLAGAVLYFSFRTKIEKQKLMMYSAAIISVLLLIDLWGVDKRYLNATNFVNKTTYTTQTFSQTPVDKIILQDTHPSYRVLNLNNPFNETNTSYYHKSIGGYHAAKLKRYQELIDHQLEGDIRHVAASFASQNIDTITASFAATTGLNLLNTKYIIYNPEQPPLINPYAMGAAWFVSEYKLVNNADEEIAALKTLDTHQTALVDKRFEAELSGLNIVADSMATIEMTIYKPNILTYKSKAVGEQLAIFSEMYFADGWQAYLDGKEVPHFRADWTLRAMRIPAGEHEIVFKFEPKDYYLSTTVATASSGLLVLLLFGMIGLGIFRRKKEDKIN
ncbi:hypothetical protein JGH11_05255 [Dysgonomonas sp. Marseille-P4677]|uniref:YfhO family protein n=1 Tax=Dysgonomonas sp. Marseille-P4677 TaxID=2364790 RepID=UPI00191192F4|nr:YfhO family protein [Dysgonomonas sp. Marseille-P4677]MBK5720273.1 hypothetical protein [Dysgonomonas sp. Marseille-P4677]